MNKFSLHRTRVTTQTHFYSGLILSLLGLFLSAGCNGEPEPQRIQYVITAIDTNELPVSGVLIYLSSYEAAWGTTDINGMFRGESTAKVGEVVSFRLEAPDGGYELIPGGPTSFQVTESPLPLEVKYIGRFKPPQREYLFIVEGTAGDQVLINNEELTTLNSSKRSMLMYTGAPGEEVIIQVGVSGYRGRLSSQGREVYMITPDQQGTLKDPSLFLGPLLDEVSKSDSDQVALAPLGPDHEIKEPQIDSPIREADPPKTSAPKRRGSTRSSSRSSRTSSSSRRTSSRRDEDETERDDLVEIAYERPKSRSKRREEQQPTRRASPVRKDEAVTSTTSTFQIDEPRRPTPPQSNPPPPKIIETPKGKSPSLGAASTSSRGSSGSEVLTRLKEGRDSARTETTPDSRSSSESSIDKGNPDGPVTSGGVASMSKSEVKSKLKEIEQRYDRSNRLTAQDISFLRQIQPTQGTSYNEAHRLLGAYYFSLNDIRRQRDSLEIAVKNGQYKSNPIVLLSLAQAHGHFKNYGPALKYLKRAEAKMGRLKGADKSNVYRTYAEYLRLHYLAMRASNPLQADTSLLDQAIQKWKRLKTMSGSGSRDAIDADKKIKQLEQMKTEAGGP